MRVLATTLVIASLLLSVTVGIESFQSYKSRKLDLYSNPGVPIQLAAQP